MPVIEISMKETRGGSVIKMRERHGRNYRSNWQSVRISGSLRATVTWQAIRFVVRLLVQNARGGLMPPSSIHTSKDDWPPGV